MGADPTHGVLQPSFSSLPPHASQSFSSQLKSRVSGHSGPAWTGPVHTVCYPGASPSPLICWSQASNKSFLEQVFVTESLENTALSTSKSSASSPLNAGWSRRWPSDRLRGSAWFCCSSGNVWVREGGGEKERERYRERGKGCPHSTMQSCKRKGDGGSIGVPDSLTQFHRTTTVSTAQQPWIHPRE